MPRARTFWVDTAHPACLTARGAVLPQEEMHRFDRKICTFFAGQIRITGGAKRCTGTLANNSRCIVCPPPQSTQRPMQMNMLHDQLFIQAPKCFTDAAFPQQSIDEPRSAVPGVLICSTTGSIRPAVQVQEVAHQVLRAPTTLFIKPSM